MFNDMKRWFFAACAAAFAVFGISACKSAPEEQHTSYETVTISPVDLEVPIKFSSTMTGRKDVSIIPQTSGQLTSVCVNPGQKVTKGQVLFRIDDRKARQLLSAREADLLAAEAQCNTALLEYQSNQNLYAKHIVSEYMLNTSFNDYNTAKAAVAQAKAALESAQLNLDYYTVTSPVDGVVGDIPNNPGDVVNETTLLTMISGNTEMKAKFSISEDKVNQILGEMGSLDEALKILPEVSFILKDGTEYTHKGKIISFSGVVDNMTGSLTCTAVFPNPEGVLYSGIQGTVQMMIPYDDLILLPLTALVRVQDKAYVFKVKDNCAESVIVEFEELGNGKDAAILSGLQAGDVIVAKGAANVYDGLQVIFPSSDNK